MSEVKITTQTNPGKGDRNLSVTTYLIIAFLFLTVIGILFALCVLKLFTLPQVSSTVTDPNVVYCDPEQVLEAWIRNTTDKVGCQPWTNNLVVADDYALYEKDFRVTAGTDSQTECCWFSNYPDQRTVVKQPEVCIVNNNEGTRIPQYTIETLNQKPYFQNGNQLSFPIPACDNDVACISFIKKASGSDIGRYKITKYNGTSNSYDQSAELALRLSFVFGDQCIGLKNIYLDSELIASVTNGNITYYIDLPDPKPQVLVDMERLFLISPGRAYPIPGLNPVLAN
jgi:hypothetical protein